MSRNISEGGVRLRVLTGTMATTGVIALAAAMLHSPKTPPSCTAEKSFLDTGTSSTSDRTMIVTCTNVSDNTSYAVNWQTAAGLTGDINGVHNSTSVLSASSGNTLTFTAVADANTNTSGTIATSVPIKVGSFPNLGAVQFDEAYLSDDHSHTVNTNSGNVIVTFTLHGPTTGNITLSTSNYDSPPWSGTPTFSVSSGSGSFTLTAASGYGQNPSMVKILPAQSGYSITITDTLSVLNC